MVYKQSGIPKEVRQLIAENRTASTVLPHLLAYGAVEVSNVRAGELKPLVTSKIARYFSSDGDKCSVLLNAGLTPALLDSLLI